MIKREESFPLLRGSKQEKDRSGFGKSYKTAVLRQEEDEIAAQPRLAPPPHIGSKQAPSALAKTRNYGHLQHGHMRIEPASADLWHHDGQVKLRSPRAGPFGFYRLSGKKKVCLSDIRSTDIQLGENKEGKIPSMQEAHVGFLSAAHLRDDEYWAEILGQELQQEGPCKWIESDFIHFLIGVAIIVNAIALSLHEVSPHLLEVEHVLLVFSVLELLITLFRRYSGVRFKTNTDAAFIALDCVVVSCSAFEKWIAPLLSSINIRTVAQDDEVFQTLVRMIWLLRFLRLIRIVPALNELAHGVMDAIQGLFWVLCFMLLLIYAIAILCTRLIGHFDADSVPDPQQQAEVLEVQQMFKDVKTSMFYLFETMSSWTLVPLIPLFQISPVTRLFFVLFYIYAGWTLLAVMTGVVSFNMIALRARITREDEAREYEKKARAKEILLEIFEYSDVDHSGELSFDELQSLIANRDIIEAIQNNTNIKKHDLEDLWYWLDEDNSESISWDEFLRGFQWLNEPFKPKTLLRLQEKITKDINVMRRHFQGLIKSTFDSIVLHVSPPMRKMHAVTEQVQLLELACTTLRDNMNTNRAEASRVNELKASQPHLGDKAITLEAFEKRIGAQIDDIANRLERFVPKRKDHYEAFMDPMLAKRVAANNGVLDQAAKQEVQRYVDPLHEAAEDHHHHHHHHQHHDDDHSSRSSYSSDMSNVSMEHHAKVDDANLLQFLR